jgi:hypothetical protein
VEVKAALKQGIREQINGFNSGQHLTVLNKHRKTASTGGTGYLLAMARLAQKSKRKMEQAKANLLKAQQESRLANEIYEMKYEDLDGKAMDIEKFQAIKRQREKIKFKRLKRTLEKILLQVNEL